VTISIFIYLWNIYYLRNDTNASLEEIDAYDTLIHFILVAFHAFSQGKHTLNFGG